MKVIAFFDGGCRAKGIIPGPAACAAVLRYADSVYEKVEDIGKQTNNVAEYRGLELALRMALDIELGPGDDLHVYSDSKLVVCQVLGEWQVKALHLRSLRDHAHHLGGRLRDAGVSLKISHIPREENTRADELVTNYLDFTTGNPRYK